MSALCPTTPLNDGTTKYPESLCAMLVLPPSQRRVPSLRRALPLLHRSLRTHAPILLPLLDFGRSLVLGVFAGCYRPRLLTGSSRRYSANLSLVAWSPATAVPSGARACYFPDVIGLPQRGVSWLPASFHARDFFVGSFSRLQTFPYVQAPKFARLPDRAHRCGLAAGRPRLLHPGRACFVASARTEYASRPNQAIGGARTCTLLDSQSCRLLPLLSEQTRFSPSPRGLLLPGFRRIGHPHRRRL